LGPAVAFARAVAIDGAWCMGSSQFSIDGPHILTPAGSRTQGAYASDGFVYIVPQSDPGAGTQIDMVLVDGETVRLTRRGQTSEIWRRCRPAN
jgi:hypothetical protein